MKKHGKSDSLKADASATTVEGDDAHPEGHSASSVDRGPGDFQSEDLIREKAYALYEARGGAGGSALDDWLMAESMLNGSGG